MDLLLSSSRMPMRLIVTGSPERQVAPSLIKIFTPKPNVARLTQVQIM
jgi:hypothetical protein